MKPLTKTQPQADNTQTIVPKTVSGVALWTAKLEPKSDRKDASKTRGREKRAVRRMLTAIIQLPLLVRIRHWRGWPRVVTLKKPRGQSSTGATSTLPKVILICGDFLGKKILYQVYGKIQEAVVNRVLALEDRICVPRFTESFYKKGIIVFIS